jgi:RNA polymerase sigma-70 factor (ECF subfamily)
VDQPSDLRTSASLLVRLRQPETDQQAWAEFVHRYGPLLHRWCKHWKLQEADIEDVSQAVLAKLVSKLQAFEYDPARSFRAYLKTLTHYAWLDLLEGRQRAGAGAGGSACLELLASLEARDDLLRRLDEEFDQEVLEEATARVRARVEPHTWEAFRLTALEGLPGAAVAARLAMKVYTVFKAKSKVQKLLQEEVARLECS